MANRWKIATIALGITALLYGFYRLDQWSTENIRRAYDYSSIEYIVKPEPPLQELPQHPVQPRPFSETSTITNPWKPLIDLLAEQSRPEINISELDHSEVNCEGLNKKYILDEFLTHPAFSEKRKIVSWGTMKGGDPSDECEQSECVYIGFTSLYYKITTTGVTTTFRWLTCGRNQDNQQIIRVNRFELDGTYVLIDDENRITHWDKTTGNNVGKSREAYLQEEEILLPYQLRERIQRKEL